MKKLYTLILLALLTPFLLANQTVDVDVPYIMTFVDNSGYDLDTGAVVSDTDLARTDKKINRNSIIYVNDYQLFTYVLFWDNLDQYIGYYTTTNSELYGTDWITATSSNEFSPPSNAYYFAYMIDKVTQNIDTPDYVDLNNLSLREVFEGGQLYDYSMFTGDATRIVTNNENSIDVEVVNNNSGAVNIGSFSRTANNKYYVGYSITTNNFVGGSIQAYSVNPTEFFMDTTYDIDRYYSNVYNVNTTANQLFVFRPLNNIVTNWSYTLTDVNLINLTSLGINLTKEQMDSYFNLYKNNPNITGIAFNTFDDLTTTYRQTFYDPLPEDSIILIVAGILGIGLMLLGFITRARIFNLFSVAPFTLIGLLLPNPAIIIAMIGLIIWQVYYAFWSKV